MSSIRSELAQANAQLLINVGHFVLPDCTGFQQML